MVPPEEAMWYVGGTGIQTEGEMEDDYEEDNPIEYIGLIIVGIIVLGLFLYIVFLT